MHRIMKASSACAPVEMAREAPATMIGRRCVILRRPIFGYLFVKWHHYHNSDY